MKARCWTRLGAAVFLATAAAWWSPVLARSVSAAGPAEQPDNTWVRLASKVAAIAFEPSMVYHRACGRLIMFSGPGAYWKRGSFPGGQGNDQWVGDPRTGEWVRVRPPEMPPQQCCVCMGTVYDEANDLVVHPAAGHNDTFYSCRKSFGRRGACGSTGPGKTAGRGGGALETPSVRPWAGVTARTSRW